MTERTTPTESLVERLHEIASWVSSSQDLEKLLELVLETAAGILNAKAGSILLLNRRTKKLVFKAATGEKKQEVKSFTINLGQGIAGHVAETGKPLLISNVTKTPCGTVPSATACAWTPSPSPASPCRSTGGSSASWKSSTKPTAVR
jgi:GAF domain-containing protein